MNVSADRELHDEASLVERCRRDDPEAFGKVVDAYQSRVYGFVRRMVRDADEAADMSQEVFVRAFQSFGRFDGRCSLRTWLFRIAHNLCIDRSRRRDRKPLETRLDPLEADVAGELPDTRWDPETMMLDAEFMTVVEQGIETMSDKLRAVLLFHDREDLTYEEIATVLNVPLGTVKSRLFLARSHLHTVIQEYLGREVIAND